MNFFISFSDFIIEAADYLWNGPILVTLLLGGGVACNERIREMASLMCNDRGATAFWPEKQYCIDNGTMIAELGRKMIKHDIHTKLEDSAINPSMRTDHAEVVWD